MSTDSQKTQCNQCGNKYASVSIHWAKSSQCDYPTFDSRHHALTTGLLLSGAYIDSPKGRKSRISVNTSKKGLAEWVRSHYGELYATSISEAYMDPDNADEIRTGEAPNFETVYRFRTRRHPTFDEYYTIWHPDGESGVRQVPSLSTPHPLSLRTLYAYRGHLMYPSDKQRSYAAIGLSRIPATSEQVQELLAPFDPQVSDGGTPYVWLTDSDSFFEYIGDATVAPDGCGGKWR